MDLAEVKAYLETNKDQEDVKSYLAALSKVTIEGAKSFIEKEEGKKWLGSLNDSFFSKGLESWKENNLQTLIDDAVKKANPAETEQQKEIRLLKERLDQKESAEKRQGLINKALLVADEKKLPKDLVEFFLGDDEENTTKNLDKLGSVMNTFVQTQVDERLKGTYTPPSGGSGDKGDGIGMKLAKQQEEMQKLATENSKNYFE